MKIGILGSGVVGQVLANGFIKHGYEVMVGTRSPEKLSGWKEKARITQPIQASQRTFHLRTGAET
ncbi:MAG: hypothetical protein A2Z21_08335 [Candidatus Fraserbacteria bacterium RBG_16_55_9]|uniref:Pyrroline-5-carboxylate reductase catalytic N-terminal domain-containing protein n=1 Tax=Fraserbacteria sp. (strain RBG_16_55_9) TaxID=1817864 RepID=A0A1F5USI5_FRAXR|nr:MAG: hypothetical protein A2Z21_08335 [Candidatus Fraserbacteria bacterium RBG_16_55_9]